MREFWSVFFTTGRSHPLALGRRDLPWGHDFIGLFHRCGVQWSFLLYSITRETHQRQLTLGLWLARWRRVGSAFEDTEFSGAKQPSKETTDVFSCRNAMRWCPPVLGYRTLRFEALAIEAMDIGLMGTGRFTATCCLPQRLQNSKYR